MTFVCLEFSFCKYLKVFDYLRTDIQNTDGINIATMLFDPIYSIFLCALVMRKKSIAIFLAQKKNEMEKITFQVEREKHIKRTNEMSKEKE